MSKGRSVLLLILGLAATTEAALGESMTVGERLDFLACANGVGAVDEIIGSPGDFRSKGTSPDQVVVSFRGSARDGSGTYHPGVYSLSWNVAKFQPSDECPGQTALEFPAQTDLAGTRYFRTLLPIAVSRVRRALGHHVSKFAFLSGMLTIRSEHDAMNLWVDCNDRHNSVLALDQAIKEFKTRNLNTVDLRARREILRREENSCWDRLLQLRALPARLDALFRRELALCGRVGLRGFRDLIDTAR